MRTRDNGNLAFILLGVVATIILLMFVLANKTEDDVVRPLVITTPTPTMGVTVFPTGQELTPVVTATPSATTIPTESGVRI